MPLTAGKVHAAQIAWLQPRSMCLGGMGLQPGDLRSEEHTSELQSQSNLVCRLLLEKKTMFSIGRGLVRSCEGLTRRQWLRVGGLGVVCLTLPGLLRAREMARSRQGRTSFRRARLRL